MRKFLLFLLFLLHKNAFSQLNDKFDDGDFTINPTWLAPNASANFVVEDGQLRSNSILANSSFYLVTTNSLALNTIWEFDCNLKLATSGSNYADIYLISNSDNLSSNNIVNGYFVRIGNTDDEISLFKRSGNLSTATKIIDGQNGTVSSTTNNPFKIRVTRSAEGEFTLEWDKSQTGNQFQLEGKVLDKQFITSQWFGIYIQQSTASFHQKHYFDNFSIKEVEIDTEAPQILSIHPDKNKLNIFFNEKIDLNGIDLFNNFSLQSSDLKIKDFSTVSNNITLEFDKEFETGNYKLIISKIKDLAGNENSEPVFVDFSYVKPYRVKPMDIVINEIFADPSPQIDLPTSEFIELYNTTNQQIALKGFKYADATTSYTFNNEYLLPNEYLILCTKSDTTEYKKYGRTVGISPWPSLNNDKDILTLSDPDGVIIHQVHYFDSWYRDAIKKNGGYTLELIDPASACVQAQNYSASIDPSGGTPGKQNSIYKSNLTGNSLNIINVKGKNDSTLTVIFNRPIDSLQACLITNYSLSQNIGNPASVKVIAPNYNTAELLFKSSISHGNTYSLNVSNIADCGGSLLKSENYTLLIPSLPKKGKVLISEILFNPRTNGQDFVELYNHSDETFDFKDLFIATTNAKDSVINIKSITTNSILFKPWTHWVISTNPDNILSEYFSPNPQQFIKGPSLPAFNNDQGVVVLLDKEHNRLDQLNYHNSMHFPLLKDVKGVSLERTFFDEDANKSGNFRSATASVGYATPAYKNSQSVEQNQATKDGISLSTKVLSPDHDGTDDILSISYQLDQNDYVANVNIYNDQGRLIKKLIKNEQVSSSGIWIWDGFDMVQNRVKTGIYILHAELFDLSGKTKQYKTAFSVIAKK